MQMHKKPTQVRRRNLPTYEDDDKSLWILQTTQKLILCNKCKLIYFPTLHQHSFHINELHI